MTEDERVGFKGVLPVSVSIGDTMVTLMPRQFASGSLGWHGNAKLTVHGWRCQVNLILTVVGSKPGALGGQTLPSPERPLEGPQSDREPENGSIPSQALRKRSGPKRGT